MRRSSLRLRVAVLILVWIWRLPLPAGRRWRRLAVVGVSWIVPWCRSSVVVDKERPASSWVYFHLEVWRQRRPVGRSRVSSHCTLAYAKDEWRNMLTSDIAFPINLPVQKDDVMNWPLTFLFECILEGDNGRRVWEPSLHWAAGVRLTSHVARPKFLWVKLVNE